MAYQFRKFKRAHRDRIVHTLNASRVGHPHLVRVDVKARHKLLKCCDMMYLPFRIIRNAPPSTCR
jgi:hypothetical protein